MIWLGSGKHYQGEAQTVPRYVLPDNNFSQDIYDLAQSTTVRIVRDNLSGTGVIIQQKEGIYTVLTSWHVLENMGTLAVVTVDGTSHQLFSTPQRVGDSDLGVVQFQSLNNYHVATFASHIPAEGDKVYAAGFPLYESDGLSNTIFQGVKAFRLTQGEISVIPPQSLPEGYILGYTNDTEVGMSGGPVFDTKGFLVGIHGRGKYRDPGFGVYTFVDGSEPSPEMLAVMIESSWGIPIATYLQYASQAASK